MKLFIFAIIAVMLSGVAMAAEVPTSEGDKAMVFMFDGLGELGLDGYGGYYGIGMRYYIADMTAIRGGVVFGKWSETEEADMPGYEDTENTYTVYGLNAVYEKHLEGPCSSVSPYWGVGGAFFMGSDEYADEYGDSWTDKETGFGGFGVLGFEWAFTGCMTLGGEYQLGFWSWSGETEYDEDGGDRTETCCKYNGSYMGFDTASVYLSVYW